MIRMGNGVLRHTETVMIRVADGVLNAKSVPHPSGVPEEWGTPLPILSCTRRNLFRFHREPAWRTEDRPASATHGFTER